MCRANGLTVRIYRVRGSYYMTALKHDSNPAMLFNGLDLTFAVINACNLSYRPFKPILFRSFSRNGVDRFGQGNSALYLPLINLYLN